MQLQPQEANRLHRLQSQARRLGLVVSRANARRSLTDTNFGGYRVTGDPDYAAGDRYELTLDDVEKILAEAQLDHEVALELMARNTAPG